MAIKVVTVRDFNPYDASFFVNSIMEMENSSQPAIIYQVNSYGGRVDSLAEMLDILDSCKKPKISVISSVAMSCGILLSSYADYRLMGGNSRTMVHQPSGMTWGKSDDIMSDAQEIQRMRDWSYGLLDQKCNKPEGYFKDLVFQNNNADLFLNAEDSLKHGLIDEIGTLQDVMSNLDSIIMKCKEKKGL